MTVLVVWTGSDWSLWLPWGLLVGVAAIGSVLLLRTRRRMAERTAQLEARRHELMGMLQAMHIAVLSVDRRGVVRDVNAAARELLNLRDDKSRGRTLRDLGADESVCAFVHGAIDGGGPRRGELVVEGDPAMELVLRAEPVLHRGSGAGDIVLVVDDVTRLRKLESMRSDFAANVSHELRTPITAIQGYAELLTEASGEDAAGHVAVIQRNAKRLSNIIEDLLSLARLEDETQAATLVRESVAVHELFDAVVRASGEEARREAVTVKVRCGDYLVCRGSRPLLEQAVGNLLTNAIRYGGGDSSVALEADLTGDGRADIRVVDHGPGIDPEHHSRVFERFYRVDRGRSRQVGGTGLGLAIVKHIALVHGGTVQLAQTPGGGCTFSLSLPLEAD